MIQENKMGTMPVNKLLISMSLPMIISMLVQAMYNIVDSVFVAQISENALTAVSLAFPLQNLMIAFAGGTAVGVNALLSRSLGEKNQDHVNQTAVNSVFIFLVTAVIFMIAGLTLSNLFFNVQTTNTEIVNAGTQYSMIVVGCSIGLFCQFLFERLLQATGRTLFTMVTQGLGAIINIILDPIFIFGLCGFPKMGVAGAALATITGQIIACLLALFFNLKFNHDIHFKFKRFRPNAHIVKQIYSVGIPSIIMQSIGSVMTFGMNTILITFSTTATAVFGVYFKLQSFVFMPVFGLNNGMIPIIAYNLGAKQKKRMFDTIKLAMIYATGMMIIGVIFFETIPQTLLGFFNASEAMIKIGTLALRIIAIHFIFAGFSIVCSATFQAVGKGTYSLLTSLIRQLLVLLPCAYVLSLTGNLDLIWLCFPIAEIFSAVTSFILMKRTRRHLEF
ncbi:MAG: MATE family efflux transporter [Thomasclavelia ramosa]|uniref:MATE family efflux transporter n=1 Tax=Thomasclavelia ramosa TaxID=1547 RepID=UPI0022E3033B|nr:MATE family efflux transporter [Thomasclavelia ramosa]